MIEIGDRVVVKEWDEMVDEFGMFSEDTIDTGFLFPKGMKASCGQEGIVVSRNSRFDKIDILFDDPAIDKEMQNYGFGVDTVSCVEKGFDVGDEVVIRDWDDMLEHYGNDDQTVTVRGTAFNRLMRPLCGEAAVVTGFLSRGTVQLDFSNPKHNEMAWTYKVWMLRRPTEYDSSDYSAEIDIQSIIAQNALLMKG